MKPGVDPDVVGNASTRSSSNISPKARRRRARQGGDSRSRCRLRGLEQVGGFGGKAVTLAQGEIIAGDSEFYRKTLANYATVTPAEVKAAMAEWLTKPAFSLRLEPGDRPDYEEAKAVAAKPKKGSDQIKVSKKRDVPSLASMQALDFPDLQHVTLANGVQLHYAQRNAVPITQMAMQFNAGYAATLRTPAPPEA